MLWYMHKNQCLYITWYCNVSSITCNKATIFSCVQAALWKVISVHLSVRLSVCLPFSLCSCHRIIMKFSVITVDKSYFHAKGQGQSSKVKVTEVKIQLSRFRTVTPVSIHIWRWNDAQGLMLLRKDALLFFKVICQLSSSHIKKIVNFDPNWVFPNCYSSFNS